MDILFGRFLIYGMLYVITVTLFTCIGCSLLIVGPWLRLNVQQEQVIRKFVPTEFLNKIQCERITNVKLGLSKQEKNLVCNII